MFSPAVHVKGVDTAALCVKLILDSTELVSVESELNVEVWSYLRAVQAFWEGTTVDSVPRSKKSGLRQQVYITEHGA